VARQFPSSLEKDQGRDAANIESSGQVLLLVGVHLSDLERRRTPLSRLVQHGRHHLAGPTPWRPEVDEDWQAAFRRVSGERRSIQGNHAAIKKLRLALGTLGMLTHAI